MIRVNIRRNPDRSIVGFTLSGHADYDELGKDIVCAGVTAVTFGMVNAVEALLHVDLQPQTPRRGYLDVNIPPVADDVTATNLQLLLESMVHILTGIDSSYRKHIKITEIMKE